jgi:hypothetical protein
MFDRQNRLLQKRGFDRPILFSLVMSPFTRHRSILRSSQPIRFGRRATGLLDSISPIDYDKFIIVGLGV